MNLQLPHLPTEGAALGHAFNCEQARLEGPIGKGAQIHWRKLFRNEAYLKQIHGRRGEGRHFGRLDAQGHLRSRFNQFFADHLARGQHVCPFFEYRGDDR